MCMYVCVCICVYMYVYVCMCMYVYVCICMYMYVYCMLLTRLHVTEDIAARQQGLLRHKKLQLEVRGL